MLHILGMGCCHPSTIIDNEFLEKLGIESSAAWIIEKIGIETRRSCLPLEYIHETKNSNPRLAIDKLEMTPAEMGANAARYALEQAGIQPEAVGLVICNCCTPIQIAPSAAQQIANLLNLKIPAYDVFTACPAFALHVDFLNSFKEERLPDYVVCVSTAAMTSKVNYNDRSDSAIWGDGAAAWVMSARHQGRLQVLKTTFDANPLRSHAVVIEAHDYFHQEGRLVRDFSVRQTVRMLRDLENNAENGIDWNRDIFIGHQANATMLQQITNNRGIPDSNHWSNVRTKGNQAGAGAPASLSERWSDIQTGQQIIVAVLGAGLSWGSVLMRAI